MTKDLKRKIGQTWIAIVIVIAVGFTLYGFFVDVGLLPTLGVITFTLATWWSAKQL